jgi:hypothetical protein
MYHPRTAYASGNVTSNAGLAMTIIEIVLTAFLMAVEFVDTPNASLLLIQHIVVEKKVVEEFRQTKGRGETWNLVHSPFNLLQHAPLALGGN